MFIDFSLKRQLEMDSNSRQGWDLPIQDHISLPLVHSDEFRPFFLVKSHRPPVLWFPALKTFPLIFQNHNNDKSSKHPNSFLSQLVPGQTERGQKTSMFIVHASWNAFSLERDYLVFVG